MSAKINPCVKPFEDCGKYRMSILTIVLGFVGTKDLSLFIFSPSLFIFSKTTLIKTCFRCTNTEEKVPTY
jgi:hypothetical protein